MSNSAVCRLCLNCNVRMHVIVGTPLQKTYESLTNLSFQSEKKPLLACYICYNLLKKSTVLAENALKAEEMLTRLLDNRMVITPSIISLIKNQRSLTCLSKTSPVYHINIIQDGLVEGCSEIIDEEMKAFLEAGEENKNLDESLPDNHHSDPKKCHTQSDSEEDILLKNISTTERHKKVKKVPQKHGRRSKNVVADDAVLHKSPTKETPDEQDDDEEILAMVKEEQMIIEQDINLKSCSITDSESPADPLDSGNLITNLNKLGQGKSETFGETPDLEDKTSGADIDVFSTPTLPSGVSFEPHKTFICNDCGKQFDKKLQLIQHIKSHNTLNTYFDCPECDYRILTRATLERHLRLHDKTRPPQDQGNKASGAVSVLSTTTLPRGVNFEPAKTFICNDCGKQFDRKTQLIQHIKSHNILNKYFNCHECDYRTLTRGTLERHLRLHDKIRPHDSVDCGPRFTRNSCSQQLPGSEENNLKAHIRGPTEAKPFFCHICAYQCSSKALFEKHMRCHTGEKPFSCDICGKKFSAKNHLQMHIGRHTGGKPFSCSKCGHKYSHKHNLDGHMRRVHKVEKIYSCNICTYQCSQYSDLKIHKTSHAGEKFSCNVCTFQCFIISQFKNHMRIHTKEKQFSCSLCGKKFSQTGNLKCHMRIHTGEKPFSCSICGRKFGAKNDLKKHTRVHTGERPFSCSVCGFKFSSKNALNVHLRRHTGEKQFSCSECEYKSAKKCNLKEHMRRHK